MSFKDIILRAASVVVFPLLIAAVFFSLSLSRGETSPSLYLMWVLLLFILANWMSWGVWGGVVTVVCIGIISVYAWMVMGSTLYLLEIFPAVVFAILLYICGERTKRLLTLRKLEIDEKERSYNILLEENKKEEHLTESYYGKAERFNRLSRIAEELGFMFSEDSICRNIISAAAETIENGERYSLYISGENAQELDLRVMESKGPFLQGTSAAGDDFNKWVVHQRQALFSGDVSKDFRFNTGPALKETCLRSLIIAPLMTGDRVLGAVRIESTRPETFNVDDLRLLAMISNIGALALCNAQLYKKTEYLAVRDDLTGLYVKRFFMERLEHEWAEAVLIKGTFSLILMDLDRYKDINDRFGHSVGDIILKKASAVIQAFVPADAVCARYGGEEFAVLLPRTQAEGAGKCAEEIRRRIEGSPFTVRRENIKITVSAGIAGFRPDAKDANGLIEIADKHLYEAKCRGRNTVVW